MTYDYRTSTFSEDIDHIVDEIKRGLPADMIANKSIYFKPGMRDALLIVSKWTINNSYVDERAIEELETLISPHSHYALSHTMEDDDPRSPEDTGYEPEDY